MPSDVKLSGPLFDGRADHAAARAAEDARNKVADRGELLARSALLSDIRREKTGRAIRGPTTTDRSRFYQSGKDTMTVTVDRDETVVTTDLASYGPWLEGTGSRNYPKTRFRGYHSFRRAYQMLDFIAQGIADEAVRADVKDMN